MLPISIEEARKILGPDESAKLSDEQLEQLIIDMEILAKMTLKAILNGELKELKP